MLLLGFLRNIDGLSDRIKNTGYVVEVDNEIVEMSQGARTEYLNVVPCLQVHAPRESFSPKNLASGPWRKLAIGSVNGVGDPYAQMLATTYFHERNPGTPFLNALFSTLISTRNRILGIREDFGSDPDRDDFWNACRIHHYPRGGGFMVGHKDTHFPSVLKSSGVPFLQVMALLSVKKVDFHTGGSFFINRDGIRTNVEDDFPLGSVVMFDGSIHHGVEDVDPDQVLDFNLASGRIAAFVNLYQVLR
jgi:hypothetical protein